MKNKKNLVTLVTKSQNGDQTALNDLISACYEDLYYFAFQTVKDPDIAADVTQESCIDIIANLNKLRSPEAFSVWVRRITFNQCARHFRQTQEVQAAETEDGESILDVLPDESAGSLPQQVLEDREFLQTMQDLLDSLPAEQRSAMMLYYYEKLSVKQIADVFSTSEGTIKSRLNYGRKALKVKIEDYEKKTGVRLHSTALPLVLLWLFRQGQQELPKIAVPALTGVTSAAAATAATASAVAGKATVAVGSGLLMKVAAGVLTAAVAIGAVVGGVTLLGGSNGSKDDTSATSPSHEEHRHSFSSPLLYDEQAHWRSCECGETDRSAHQLDGRGCTVCDFVTASTGLKYREVNGGYAVIGMGDCTDTAISIPSSHNGKPVVAIMPSAVEYEYEDGEYVVDSVIGAFENCDSITSVFIPGSVKTIEQRSFMFCSALSSVVLSEGIEIIEKYAFDSCVALTKLEIPKTVTKMTSAFTDCTALTDITLPEGITNIDWAFSGCTSLTHIDLPHGITSINSAFYGCTSLTDIVIPDSVTHMNESFYNCTALQGMLVPNSVIEMDFAFYNCSALTHGNVPEHVTAANHAFYGCSSLEECVFAADASKMNEYTLLFDFWNIPSLKEFRFEGTHWQYLQAREYLSNLKSGANAILRCTDGYYALTGEFIHETMEIESYASNTATHWEIGLCHCKSEPVPHTFENGFCTVCERRQASEGLELEGGDQNCMVVGLGTCTDTALVIPSDHNGVPIWTIGSYAFYECETLKDVIIEDGITWIKDWAFWYCTSMQSITIPDTVCYIAPYAFKECISLKEVTLPRGNSNYVQTEGISHIYKFVFSRCSALTKVTIPDNCMFIDEGAFLYCSSLTDIYFEGTMAQWKAIEKDETKIRYSDNTITQYAWDYGTGEYVVHCSDGDIPKSEA